MDSVGAEVGQKMRSAIKAKLMELNCYVDDELPDYIMVMVANRRTKSQMNEDLNLFLSAKTSTFVNWLHIVLKKLKQVTVTNPEVYKKAIKRKGNNNVESINNEEKTNVKDEKLYKKVKKEEKLIKENEYHSMTDNLPIAVNKLSGNRKVIVETNKTLPPMPSESIISEDNFDIPLLSEVNDSVNEENLQEIEKKIRNVKTRLGLLVDDDHNVKLEEELTTEKDNNSKLNSIVVEKVPHKRITFETDYTDEEPVKKSVKSRLGKRFNEIEISNKTHNNRDRSRSPIIRSSIRNKSPISSRNRSPVNSREQSKKTNILSRLGVQSKIEVVVKKPPVIIAEAKRNDIEKTNNKEAEEEEEEFKVIREVQSAIKVKPRVIPQNMRQANKNLLLKAVAEAQRSIAQTKKVGRNVELAQSHKKPSLYTKKFTEKPLKSKEIAEKFKGRLESIITKTKTDDDDHDVTETLDNVVEEEFSKNTQQQQQQFIITLDGLNELDLKANDNNLDCSIKSTEENKRTHSPIIFSKNEISTNNIKINNRAKSVPDTLPLVHPSVSVKKKERCKYWPVCRQGNKCEYVHPTENCKTFPLCKFGNQCLYTHPACKFRTSCTKRDCPYEHNIIIDTTTSCNNSKIQYCKFYPNCSNVNCPFVHPQLGQNFGNYFKNVKWTAK